MISKGLLPESMSLCQSIKICYRLKFVFGFKKFTHERWSMLIHFNSAICETLKIVSQHRQN